MIKKLGLAAAAALLSFGMAGAAQATLIGDSVTVRIAFPNASNLDETGSTTVTADATDAFELTNFENSTTFGVDPFDGGLVVTLLQMRSGGGLAFGPPAVIEFSDLQWQGTPGRVTGATIEENFAIDFGLLTDITFTDNSVRVALDKSGGAAGWGIGEVLTINLETAHDLPEPASLALFGLGLLGLGVAARRRRTI